MELIALGALVALVWWWRRRRRAGRSKPKPARGPATPTWAPWLDRPDVLIVDTETTGLGNRAEVIEVAAIDTTGAIRYEAMSLPVGRISAGAARVHGLSRRKLKAGGARPWPEVHAELAAVLSGAAVVFAWNAGFDRRLLSQTAERHGLNPSPVAVAGSDRRLPRLGRRGAGEGSAYPRRDGQAHGCQGERPGASCGSRLPDRARSHAGERGEGAEAMSGTMAIRTVAAAAAALALVLYAANGAAVDPRQGAATEPGPKLIPIGPAKSACLSFHFGIADIDLKPEDWGRARGRQTIGRLFRAGI